MLAGDEGIGGRKKYGPDTGCDKGAPRGEQEIVVLLGHFSNPSSTGELICAQRFVSVKHEAYASALRLSLIDSKRCRSHFTLLCARRKFAFVSYADEAFGELRSALFSSVPEFLIFRC